MAISTVPDLQIKLGSNQWRASSSFFCISREYFRFDDVAGAEAYALGGGARVVSRG